MVKPTIIKITKIDENDIQATWKSKCLILKSFDFYKKLTVEIPLGAMTIYELADFIVGCFEPESTFEWVNSITFTFNTITLTVSKDEAFNNPMYVVNKWKAGWDNAFNMKSKNK